MKYGIMAVMAVALLTSCGNKYAATYSGYAGAQDGFNIRGSSSRYQESEQLTQSLFDFKERTITEADIQKALNSKVLLPDSVRLAVLNLSNVSSNRKFSYFNLDEDFFKIQERYYDTLEFHLNENHRLDKYMVMPSLVVGAAPNIYTLRESAVRMQADALLIFTLTSDIYQKYKPFDKNRIKAYATAEVLLMDVRTGMITHSQIVTKDKKAEKSDKDLNNAELVKRAQQEAILSVMDEVGRKLNQFLLEEK
jgi:hypothetical protein